MGVHEQTAAGFGAQAENYERGRPGWPEEAIAQVIERFGAHTVLDLAAGTGKLTRVLVKHAREVIAVEPVDGMRAVLEREVPAARILEGTAEAIPLHDESIEAVFGPLREDVAPNVHVMDRELLLANMSSHSSIGALPPDRLAAAMAAVTEVAEHHGIDHATIPIRTLIYTAQKRSGESGPSAG